MPLPAHPVARGAGLIVAGMAVIGFIDNFVWVIAAEISVWQFHLVRAAMALPLLALATAAFRLQLRPKRPARVAVRAAVQGVAMLCYFAALGFLPIAQVGAALFTAPLFVLIFAALLFGQRIGPRQFVAVAVGFTGVMLILRPDPATIGLETLMPLAAGALYGLGNLLTREWCADEPVGGLLASQYAALGLLGAAGSLALALHPAGGEPTFLTAPWAMPSGTALGWIAAQAVGSLAAVGLVTRGYQFAATSTLAVFEYSFLICAGLWAFILRGETLDAPGALGITLIIASGIIAAGAPFARPVARGPAAQDPG
jgi:drug/metabolite transporter (DMT)-like permease